MTRGGLLCSVIKMLLSLTLTTAPNLKKSILMTSTKTCMIAILSKNLGRSLLQIGVEMNLGWLLSPTGTRHSYILKFASAHTKNQWTYHQNSDVCFCMLLLKIDELVNLFLSGGWIHPTKNCQYINVSNIKTQLLIMSCLHILGLAIPF